MTDDDAQPKDGPGGAAGGAISLAAPIRERLLHPTGGPARIHLAGDLLEQFFVSAVVAVLGIRLYLQATGYPQVGGGNLHIAHMLWGGLLMLIALTLTLTFLGRRVRTWVAILGGLGFGTFIDEVGKFITADNDYLYRPAWIVIYVIFIVMFFGFTALARRQHPGGRPAVVTALDMIQDAALYGLGRNDREVILRLLDDAGPDAELAAPLREMVRAMPVAAERRPGLINRVQDRLRAGYRAVTRAAVFRAILVGIWLLMVLGSAGLAVAAIVGDPDFGPENPSLGTTDLIQLGVALVMGVLASFGVVQLRRRRLAAWQWFRRAVLVSLLVGQPIAFFQTEVLAMGGLLVDLVLLGAFNFGISQEIAEREQADPSEQDHTPGFLGEPA